MFGEKLVGSAIKGLSKHPEALLAFLFALMSLGAIRFGIDPTLSVGAPCLFFVLYLLRDLAKDRHKERLADASVRRLEAERGHANKRMARRVLEKRKGKNDA